MSPYPMSSINMSTIFGFWMSASKDLQINALNNKRKDKNDMSCVRKRVRFSTIEKPFLFPY